MSIEISFGFKEDPLLAGVSLTLIKDLEEEVLHKIADKLLGETKAISHVEKNGRVNRVSRYDIDPKSSKEILRRLLAAKSSFNIHTFSLSRLLEKLEEYDILTFEESCGYYDAFR